eukprot:TRINITY_DN82704_c0_g1_i1.p1 TRINITY_DN82704_c0_g1~~TRINITY_DN82704_c0_g1_i1.p1  ORF type:complete len:141 (-),score=33.05 TRINITY_DN82704_c0_g1_i1:153-575(-)
MIGALRQAANGVTKLEEHDEVCSASYKLDDDITIVLRLTNGKKFHFHYGIKNPVFGNWNLARSMVFVNKWNDDKSFTKAVVDNDGDIGLRMEVDLSILKSMSDSLPHLVMVFSVSAKAITLEMAKELRNTLVGHAGGSEL